jgi:uncharacterized membrane protein YdjX (TVP38/TMEM64 family)
MKLRYKASVILIAAFGLVGLLLWLWLDYRTVITQFFTHHFDQATLIQQIREQGSHNALILIIALALGSAIPGVPIAAIAVLAGVCFGRWPGFLINIAGIVAGNLLALELLGKLPQKPQTGRLAVVAAHLQHVRHPRLGLTIGYAIPMLPTALVNYTSTKLNMGFYNQLLCIVLGSLPVSFLYAFGGDALLQGHLGHVLLALGIVLLLFGGYEIIRRDQRREKVDQS